MGFDWMDGFTTTAVTPRASLQSDANNRFQANSTPNMKYCQAFEGFGAILDLTYQAPQSINNEF